MEFEPATSRFPTAVTSETCVMQASDDSADMKSARNRQFYAMEKNADY